MLRIHGEMQRQVATNCSVLARTLEVSRKTVLRDIAFMRDQLSLPIAYDAGKQTYRYSREVASFPTVQVTEGELVGLLVAQRALEQYRGTPFHRQLETAFDKLTAGLSDRISFSPSTDYQAISFKNFGLGKTDLAVFDVLGNAVLHQTEVEFDYRKPGEKLASRRRVRPYHLSHRENLWYLVGFDVEREALRTFALPRASRAISRKKHFVRPSDFSADKFFSSALGVLSGTGNHHIVVRFTAQAADRVREREWHHSEQLKGLPDGGLQVELRLSALFEAERWILSWGGDAEVLAPAELRANVAAQVQRLQRLYLAGPTPT
jgi:proteasome accessory factor B